MYSTLKRINYQRSLFTLQKRFIGANAAYQSDTTKVRLKGKFLPSRKPDMPTLLWFPDVMEPAENFEKWFTNPINKVLDYRNVWLLNPRNFGDSDHHDSFDMEDISNDILRFINEKKLTYVTVGGHGYGAKIACVFGSMNYNRVSGVACFEGGPLNHTYYEAWEKVRNYIVQCSKIPTEGISATEFQKRIDTIVDHPKWKAIIKQNLIEGKSGGFQWKFNINRLALNVAKGHSSDICKWTSAYGLYPGRAFVVFAEYSHWVFLNTNTIPFYKFFPKLEGQFTYNHFNFIQGDENPLNHWIHEYPKDEANTVMGRFSRWLRNHDGVNILLADRSEIGWYGIEERDSHVLGLPGAETVPEHLHHNWMHTDAYAESKKRRGVTNATEFGKKGRYSNEEVW